MPGSSARFTFRDLLVAVALALVATGASLQAARNARSEANRVACASNLRQIGQAIQIYAAANKGAFPRTVFDGAADPAPTAFTGAAVADPFGTGGPGPNDVTAPMFLLLRVTGIAPEVFICPTASYQPGSSTWTGNVALNANFPSALNLSYGYTNPYPAGAARTRGFKLNWTLSPDFAIAADMGTAAAGKVAANVRRRHMTAVNSPNHAGEGQLVLYADVHAAWSPTVFAGSPRPITGAPRDNIFAFGIDASSAAPSAGTPGAPQDEHDSVILPAVPISALPPPGPAARTARPLLMFGSAALLVIIAVRIVRSVRRTPSAAGRDGGNVPPLPRG